MEVCEVAGGYADYFNQSGYADHDFELLGTPFFLVPMRLLARLRGSCRIVSTSGLRNS